MTIEEYNTRFPKSNEDGIMKMEKDVVDLYLDLYTKYNKLFNQYIIKKLNLKKYDELIEKNNLGYLPITEENMDIYQDMSSVYMKYFYLRNNLYIERLTNEEKIFLLKSSLTLGDDEFEFIENTFQKVILEGKEPITEIYNVNYGPESENFYAPNNAVVIGFRYDEFNLNGMDDITWDNNYMKQLDELSHIIESFYKENINTLNIPIRVIKYDDYSIKKKNTMNKQL